MHQIFKSKRVLFLTLILTGITFAVALIVTYIDYNSAVKSKKMSLFDEVRYEKDFIQTLYEEGFSKDSILSIIRKTNNSESIGNSGEFAIAELIGDSIHFLDRKSLNGEVQGHKVYIKSGNAIPMRMAIQGINGVVKGKDYRGVEVFAGISCFEPFHWGIVAKIEVSEVNSPYLNSLLISLLLALVLTFIGAVLFIKVTTPMIDEIIQSEESLSITLQSIGDGVITTDEFGSVTGLNPIAENLCGWKTEEARGKPIEEIFKIVNAHTRLKVINPVKTVIEKGIIVGLANHTVLISRDGTEYQISDSAAPIKTRENKIVGVVFTFADVTEKYQSAEKIRISEKFLRETQKIAKIGTYTLDIKTGIWSSSEVLDEIFGIDVDYDKSITGWVNIIHPDWQKIMNDYFANEVIGKKTKFDKEYKIIRQNDKEERWMHGKGELRFDENNNSILMLGTIQDITERKNIENEILQSKERFESLFNNSPYPVAIYKAINDGEDFMFTDFNQAAEATDKISRELIVGKTIKAIFPAAEELNFLDVFRKVWQTGETTHMPVSNYKDNRIEGWRDNIIYKLNTGEVVAIYNDITEKKQAEIVLRESEEKFSKLFQSNPAASTIVRISNGQFVEINKAAEKLLGYRKDELVGKTSADIGLYADSLEHKKIWEIVRNVGHLYDYEVNFYKKDGTLIITKISLEKIVVNGEESVISNYEDITQRKQAEEALSVARKRLDNAIYSGRIAWWEMELPSGLVKFSELKSQMLGFPSDNFKYYSDFTALIHPDDYEGVMQSMREHIDGISDSYNVEYRIKKSNGEYVWFKDIGKITERQGNLNKTTLTGVVIDINDLKLTELELISAKEKAEESEKLKTAFLQNMSHEISTPMNAIVGFSNLLNKSDLTAEERNNFTNIIQNSSKQLLSIVSDILTIASLETKREKVNLEEVSINEIMRNLESVFFQQNQAKGINLSLNIQLDDNSSTIYTDKTKITQILTNLLSNASKFTHQGYIKFGYERKNNFLQFYVQDTGIGIKIDSHQTIFERFRQADSSISNRYGGTGLGLSISKSFCELLGGEIWVESEPEKGSTFYFTIPYSPVASGKSQNVAKAYNIQPNNNLKTILIVEDEEVNFLYLKELLKHENLFIISANNGQEAVDVCKSNPHIGLILMDIKMPVMDGHTAAKIIKEFRPELPIIAQTAYALKSEIDRFGGIFDEYATKPIDGNKLKILIKKFL